MLALVINSYMISQQERDRQYNIRKASEGFFFFPITYDKLLLFPVSNSQFREPGVSC